MPESYTGDEGDDALAEGYAIMDGTEDRRDGWKAINKTRDFIANLKVQLESLNLSWSAITGKPSTFPASYHTHSRLQYGSALLAWRPAPFNEWNTANNMYVGGYLNVIGTIFNPSTRRIKRDITPANLDITGLFPDAVEYTRVDGDGTRELGYIAEDLIGTDAERWVKLDAEGRAEAIAYLNLHIAQIANLHQRLVESEARIAQLEQEAKK